MITHSQILWRCRRGMLELDLLLQHYANEHYMDAPKWLQEQFLLLLDESDQDLQRWLLNGEKRPSLAVADIIAEISEMELSPATA